MGSAFIYLGAFVLAISILVVIHELGHYAVARWFDVKVLRFSLGFGRTLWCRRFGPDQTEWALCAVPLGGYVRMVDEREGSVDPADVARAFNRQTLGRRSLIVLAGPIANLLLAIALYFCLFMVGVAELKPRLDAPDSGTPASLVGLQQGDLIVGLNGEPVAGWEALRWEMLKLIADHLPAYLDVVRLDGSHAKLVLPTEGISIDTAKSDPMQALGLGVEPPHLPPIVGAVVDKQPAAEAGLRKGDRILSINGEPIIWWGDVYRIARASPGISLAIDYERNGVRMSVSAIPLSIDDKGHKVGRLGFAPHDDPAVREAMQTMVRYPPLEAFRRATAQTWDSITFTLRMMGRLVLGKLSVKNISGPLTIAEYAGVSVQLGLAFYVKFLAAVSIGIGVLNLLPIPVLDGGHLMYYLVEFIRGKPLSEGIFAVTQRVGMVAVLLLMCVALFNDLNRLLFG